MVPQDEVPDAADPAPAEAPQAEPARTEPAQAEIGAPIFASTPAAAASIAEPVALPPEEEAEEGEEEEPDESDSEIEEESLARLMNRFETGLSHKQQALPSDAIAAASAAVPDGEAAERIGHRLRSAITDLNKISARGR
jgi:hypothetical protein